MLIERMNFQYNFRRKFLTIVIIFGIFFVAILENIYAEDDDNVIGDSKLPFNHFYNYQNLDNYKLESSNIIPNQFIVYLQEDNKEEESNSIDPFEFYNSELKDTGTELLYVYSHVVKGFAIKIPNEKVLEQLKKNPLVNYIGQDKTISAAFINKKQTNSQQIIPTSIDRGDGEQSFGLVNAHSKFVNADIAILDTNRFRSC
jgi:hypothetical protein